jgi:hypothetical protein
MASDDITRISGPIADELGTAVFDAIAAAEERGMTKTHR